MTVKKTLLIIDVQNDFCPGGALPVAGADAIIPILNRYIRLSLKRGLPIFASRDWHPRKTRHFKKFGGRWPIHCVQNTEGAQFHPCLRLPMETVILSKGMDPNKESYSAFQGVDSNRIRFIKLLRTFGIDHILAGGLATDYCVRWSVLDAIKYGFKVTLLRDAIKGVDLEPGDSERAIKDMVKRGARLITIKRLLY